MSEETPQAPTPVAPAEQAPPAAAASTAKVAPAKPAKPSRAPKIKGLLIYLEGMDGQIALTADRIIITRKGFFNILMYGLTAQREIPLGAVSEVVFKEPTLLAPGHIEFVISGRANFQTDRVNHNAVKFQKQHQSKFLELKEKVFALIEWSNRQKAQ